MVARAQCRHTFYNRSWVYFICNHSHSHCRADTRLVAGTRRVGSCGARRSERGSCDNTSWAGVDFRDKGLEKGISKPSAAEAFSTHAGSEYRWSNRGRAELTLEKLTMDPELEVMEAEREVQTARARLGAEFEAVTKTGKKAISALTARARPLAIGVAVVAGVVVLAGVVRAVRGAMARPRPPRWVSPTKRSLPRKLFDSAVASALSAVGSYVARQAANTLRGSVAPTKPPNTHRYTK